MSSKADDFIKGLLIGGLMGAVIGILYAPKSGRETREEIGRKAEDLMVKAKEEYEAALEKSKKAYDAAVQHLKQMESSAKEKVEEMEEKVGELAERGKDTLQDTKSRLKKAIDASVDAFKEEKG
jgi:gas vesicle protein